MNRFQVYILSKLDEFREALGGIAGITTLASGIEILIILCLQGNPDQVVMLSMLTKALYFTAPTAVVSFLVMLLMPSLKQAAAVIVIPPVINNKSVQTIPKKLVNLADEWVQELKPKKRRKR